MLEMTKRSFFSLFRTHHNNKPLRRGGKAGSDQGIFITVRKL